jgi:hypothetical protein
MENKQELELYTLGDPMGNIQEFGQDAYKVAEVAKQKA